MCGQKMLILKRWKLSGNQPTWAIKTLPVFLLSRRRFLGEASQALSSGLALGMGSGLGEATYPAHGIAQRPVSNQLPAMIEMPNKNHLLLLFIFALAALSLLSALVPALDIDADGCSDSLVTEGLLFAFLVSTSIALLYLSTRFVSIPLASPWLLSFLRILPPITTL